MGSQAGECRQPLVPSAAEERETMNWPEHLQSCKQLIEDAAACSVQMLANMIKDTPAEAQPDLWCHAHAALEQAIRERLEQGPIPGPVGTKPSKSRRIPQ
jgi:hypothetical protein